MNRTEAKAVLTAKMRELSKVSYSELKERLLAPQPQTMQVVADSGAEYHIEIDVRWDAQPEGDIRVMGAIDAGGWGSLFPVCVDFIISPDGSLFTEW